jgi:hypothetical protein
MGNENIYMLTNNEDYALRIELEDFEGNKRSLSMKFNLLKFLCFSVFYDLESRELIFDIRLVSFLHVSITGMRNIHTSKSTPKPITTNLKSTDTKEMLETR